ncbi:serine hydrolase domain-containing protein [Sphingomonas edaphi]|uniref:Class A beta-lactamase-related serine hydrolase n=1 Tax=Sphingomonas edaphi TaxID=2315689 RepID=A0A418Q089_9SPHN|nr:serine hydrolase domain-containing protein [Sphingomonas edaphi]RIX29364.1 class A beta-lactamase-related serine hydrolase [Sphingomonas edaphi]
MDRKYKLGIGAFALGLGAFALAQPFVETKKASPSAIQAAQAKSIAQASARLAVVEPASRSRIDYKRLDERLQRMVEKPTMVGMAVGIVENGRITFLNGYGETLEGSGEKVTPETVFRWASVSKGVAATMVAKLEEKGKLRFDQSVASVAPSLHLPGGNELTATVGDVLSHRLGLYRNAFDNKLEEGQDASFLRASLVTLNSICPPGTCWSYQNVAYDAASEMATKVTGVSYPDLVQRELFAPLGMTSASMDRNGLVSAPSWARPHSVGRRPLEVNDNYYRVPAAGGVNSNIKDMSLWMLAQLGQMPQVLSPKLLETIHAARVKTPGERGRMRKFLERLGQADYGYGWRSYEYAGHHIIGHRGGVAGYRSLILFDPKLKSGVVALWNSNTSQPGGLEFEVMDMLYGLEFRDWMEIDKGGPAKANQVAVKRDRNRSA